jgi:hypothetical protein
MSGHGLKAKLSLVFLSVGTLSVSLLSPISLPSAKAAPALVTCVNLISEKERVSRTGECRPGREAQANWHKNVSDSAIAVAPNYKEITTCSESQGSPNSYRIIRKKCARNQVTTSYYRSRALPAKPLIAQVVAYSHDTAVLTLAEDPKDSTDAPVAFYTITATKVNPSTESRVETQRVYSWRDLRLVMSGLQSLTTYTLTITATTIDGTSPVSIASMPITTAAYVPPKSTTTGSDFGPASMLTVTRASVGTAAGVAFTTQPRVEIQDANGNTVTSSSAVVTATISSRGSLIGTTTATASAGVATFNNLGLRGFGGTAYTITFASTGLTSATEMVTPSAYALGATGPGGGKIYYIAPNADGFNCGQTFTSYCFYLEVAPSNWSGAGDLSMPWAVPAYLSNNIAGIPDESGVSNNSFDLIGKGYQYSQFILDQNVNPYNAVTNQFAAGAARDYRGQGLSDWYLPSSAELNTLCQWNRGLTQSFTTICSGGSQDSATYGAQTSLMSGTYWASSENGASNNGKISVFGTGQAGLTKTSTASVRPIRSF